MRRNCANFRKAQNSDTIATRIWAEFVSGKLIRALAARNGGFFKKARGYMELYFLRHGEADWPNWKKSDDARPLTKRGKGEMREVAALLKRIKARPDIIVTSPLPRASQT